MSIAQHYARLIEATKKSFEDLCEDADGIQSLSVTHNSIEALEALRALCAGRPEYVIYENAVHEFSFAILSAASARYRHAHISLRLFIEMALSSVLYSAHEIDVRLWERSSLDFSWARVTDLDEGIFSKKFLRAFFEDIADEGTQYRTIALKLYRECSEHVHGNANSHTESNKGLNYDGAAFSDLIDKINTARILVEFAMLSRYLALAAPEVQNEVEAVALGEFGHLTAVQSIYNRG